MGMWEFWESCYWIVVNNIFFGREEGGKALENGKAFLKIPRFV